MKTCTQCGVKIDPKSVTGLCHDHWLAAGGAKIPIPDDFATYAIDKGWRDLAARYKVSRSTITIWRREVAIQQGRRVAWNDDDDAYIRAHYRSASLASMAEHLGRSPAAVKSRARLIGLQLNRKPPQLWRMADRQPSVAGRVKGRADMAADHIRAHDRTPVYRCNPDGQPNPKGSHWKYGHGSLVLTEAELFAKAERKGWSAGEWQRLAA